MLVGFGVALLEGGPRVGAEELDQFNVGALCIGGRLNDVHGGAEGALQGRRNDDTLAACDGFFGHGGVGTKDGAIGHWSGDFGAGADGGAGAEDGAGSAVAGVQDGVGDAAVEARVYASGACFSDEAVVDDVLDGDVRREVREEGVEGADVAGGGVYESEGVHWQRKR